MKLLGQIQGNLKKQVVFLKLIISVWGWGRVITRSGRQQNKHLPTSLQVMYFPLHFIEDGADMNQIYSHNTLRAHFL